MEFNPKRTTIILVLISCIPFYSLAQEYTFKVLVNRGKNEIKTSTGWEQIRVGVALTSADEFRIVDNAYLGLVHVNGKPLEIKEPGNYKVTDLAARVGQGSSVLNKYTDFILSQNSEKKNNLAATGAVHRGIGIDVYLPEAEKAMIYGNIVALRWSNDKPGPYVVNFKNVFGEELSTIETNETSVRIDLYGEKFLNEENILVEVDLKQNNTGKPDSYILKKMAPADKERIKNELKQLESSIIEKNALNLMILAAFYESNNLLIDAGTTYLEAMSYAPEVPVFDDIYDGFLVRHGLRDVKE